MQHHSGARQCNIAQYKVQFATQCFKMQCNAMTWRKMHVQLKYALSYYYLQ